jgi:hypothetical protein
VIGLATTASITLDKPRLSGVPILLEIRITEGCALPDARRKASILDISPSQSLLSGPPSRMTAPGTWPLRAFPAVSGDSDIGLSPDLSTIFDITTRLIDDFPTTSTLEKSVGNPPPWSADFRCFAGSSSRLAGHMGWAGLWFNAGLKPEAQLA